MTTCDRSSAYGATWFRDDKGKLRRVRMLSAGSLAILLVATTASPVAAIEIRQDDWRANLDVTSTLGVAVRTSSRDTSLLTPADAAVIGLKGNARGGYNSNDSELNYGHGDVTSSVGKSFARLDVSNNAGYGATASAYGWYDYTGENSGVPFGNLPNGYQAGQPLGQGGAPVEARFGGIMLEEAFLHGNTTQLGGNLNVKLGQQILKWGSALTVPGGLRELDPRNFAAVARPGFVPDEGYIPFPAIEGRWDVTPNLRFEAFLQLQETHSILAQCGTYTASYDYAQPGCNGALVSAARTDRNDVLGGLLVRRAADVNSRSLDTFGAGVSYLVSSLQTRFSLYAAQYAERLPVINEIRGPTAGLSSPYYATYPDGTKVVSLFSETSLPAQALNFVVEVNQVIDQPFLYNQAEILLGPGGIGPYASRFPATPVGDTLRGYDRHATTQVGFAADKLFKGFAGADETQVGVEFGGKIVEGLPPVDQRHYLRSDVFGGYNSPGVVCANPVACSKNGFVTPFSAGYRLRGSLVYRDVMLPGITIKPSLTFFHDFTGTSSDGAFVNGRFTIRGSVDANFGTRYFGNISYVATPGGQFNTKSDRQFATVSAGVKF